MSLPLSADGTCQKWVDDHTTTAATSNERESCARALTNVHAFLHGELPEDQADTIREHLMACESCMDDYEIESLISSMVRRCNPPLQASPVLRVRVSQLHVQLG
jgi:anti-sigma factor (TIGR02949 family)